VTRPNPHIALTGILLASALFASPAMAEVETATGRAVVLNPLSVVNTSDLDFGTLVAGTTLGTATINPTSGTRTTSGGTIAAGGAPQAATFVATGVVNRLYILALGTAPVLANGSGGTMPLSVLILDGPALRIFGSGGTTTIRVGGILDLAASQPDGDYIGTFDLTVVYL
jgi:Domain of unknown function (DUF4402)